MGNEDFRASIGLLCKFFEMKGITNVQDLVELCDSILEQGILEYTQDQIESSKIEVVTDSKTSVSIIHNDE